MKETLMRMDAAVVSPGSVPSENRHWRVEDGSIMQAVPSANEVSIRVEIREVCASITVLGAILQ